MKNKITKEDNFLDLIPVRSDKIKWEVIEDNLIQIIIPRDKRLDKIVRLFFKTPTEIRIDLDMIGSAFWNSIDDKRNIEEIGAILKEELAEKAEPLYERLGTYINILRNNNFIELQKESD